VIAWLRRRFARRRLIRACQSDLGWSRGKSTIFVDALLTEYVRVTTRKEPVRNDIPNHTRIALPRALVPRGNHESVSRSSLTLAVLRAHEQCVPIEQSIAGDVSSYRSFFHGIPGVAS
jgi:hypothetical protein